MRRFSEETENAGIEALKRAFAAQGPLAESLSLSEIVEVVLEACVPQVRRELAAKIVWKRDQQADKWLKDSKEFAGRSQLNAEQYAQLWGMEVAGYVVSDVEEARKLNEDADEPVVVYETKRPRFKVQERSGDSDKWETTRWYNTLDEAVKQADWEMSLGLSRRVRVVDVGEGQ